jgi:hypothetical protein
LNGLSGLIARLVQPVTNLLNPFNLFNPFNLLWPCHRSVNTTVTVMITATASPLSVVGVKVH